MRVAGIMSGTSVDGIDVAIVDIAGKSSQHGCAASVVSLSGSIRARLLPVSNAECHTAEHLASQFRTR